MMKCPMFKLRVDMCSRCETFYRVHSYAENELRGSMSPDHPSRQLSARHLIIVFGQEANLATLLENTAHDDIASQTPAANSHFRLPATRSRKRRQTTLRSACHIANAIIIREGLGEAGRKGEKGKGERRWGSSATRRRRYLRFRQAPFFAAWWLSEKPVDTTRHAIRTRAGDQLQTRRMSGSGP